MFEVLERLIELRVLVRRLLDHERKSVFSAIKSILNRIHSLPPVLKNFRVRLALRAWELRNESGVLVEEVLLLLVLVEVLIVTDTCQNGLLGESGITGVWS